MNFWDQTHPLSKQADELYDKLVPSSGHCTTVQGELIRASNRIAYDWYNNGWGCNNWSGAVLFLQKYLPTLPVQLTDAERKTFDRAIQSAHVYSHGESVRALTNAKADAIVTAIHEHVVKMVLANPAPIANTVDLFSLQEPKRWETEEDDEDNQWG